MTSLLPKPLTPALAMMVVALVGCSGADETSVGALATTTTEPVPITAPDLICKDVGDARVLLEEADLVGDFADEDLDRDGPVRNDWKIIGQTPKPSEELGPASGREAGF